MDFNSEKHLDASLIASHCGGRLDEVKDPHKLTGTLRFGEEIQIDSLVKMSADAMKKHFDQVGHPTLTDEENGMCLEIKLTWTENGQEMSRTFYAPIAVQTRNAAWANLTLNFLFWGVLCVAAPAPSESHGEKAG